MSLARLLVLALLALAGVAGAQEATWRVEREGDAVVFRGQINPQSAAAFLRQVADPAVKRVVLNSQGGNVAAALDMADTIFDRALDVEVPRGCYSSCANYLFPAGRRKTLGRIEAVGWHGNMAHVLYLQQTGQAQWPERELLQARDLALREAAFYRRIGVDGYVAWFGKLPPYAVDEFYALSVEDMARFGIGEVTVGNDLAAPLENVQTIQVDWATIDADRPAVSLR